MACYIVSDYTRDDKIVSGDLVISDIVSEDIAIDDLFVDKLSLMTNLSEATS